MMDPDERLMDYNSALIVASAPKGFNDYSHFEKKLLIHKMPLHEQRELLMEAFIKYDDHYIYEFDKETKKMREDLINKSFGLSMAFVGFYGFSNYFFWRKLRPLKAMRTEFKFLYFLAMNLCPLLYFGYEFSGMYYKLDDFLFKKYLENSNPRSD